MIHTSTRAAQRARLRTHRLQIRVTDTRAFDRPGVRNFRYRQLRRQLEKALRPGRGRAVPGLSPRRQPFERHDPLTEVRPATTTVPRPAVTTTVLRTR